MVRLSLRREGTAGVCGVCGEMGLPGEEAVETEVPCTMGGTLESCLLEELEERCRSIEEFNESDSWVFESRMPLNLDSAA